MAAPVMTGPSNSDWSRAFHGQAMSDFFVFEHLAGDPSIPRCHALQNLQMASEKIAKAYRLAADPRVKPGDLKSHAVVRAFFRVFLRRPEVVRRWRVSGYAVAAERAKVENSAASVEKLAPAADQHQQPRNTEYPWETDGVVRAPIDEDYAELGPASRDLQRYLAVLRLALDEFESLA